MRAKPLGGTLRQPMNVHGADMCGCISTRKCGSTFFCYCTIHVAIKLRSHENFGGIWEKSRISAVKRKICNRIYLASYKSELILNLSIGCKKSQGSSIRIICIAKVAAAEAAEDPIHEVLESYTVETIQYYNYRIIYRIIYLGVVNLQYKIYLGQNRHLQVMCLLR